MASPKTGLRQIDTATYEDDKRKRLELQAFYMDLVRETGLVLSDIDAPKDPAWQHPEWWSLKLQEIPYPKVSIIFPLYAMEDSIFRKTLAELLKLRIDEVPLHTAEQRLESIKSPAEVRFAIRPPNSEFDLACKDGLVSLHGLFKYDRGATATHLGKLAERLMVLAIPHDQVAQIQSGELLDHMRWRPQLSQRMLKHAERTPIKNLTERPKGDELTKAREMSKVIEDCFSVLDLSVDKIPDAPAVSAPEMH